MRESAKVRAAAHKELSLVGRIIPFLTIKESSENRFLFSVEIVFGRSLCLKTEGGAM
jgi:hypothetical protein